MLRRLRKKLQTRKHLKTVMVHDSSTGKREKIKVHDPLGMLGNPVDFVTTLGKQGEILLKSGDWNNALMVFKQAELESRRIGYRVGLLDALGKQAMILNSRGEFDEAGPLVGEALPLAETLGIADVTFILQELARYNRARRRMSTS